LIGGVSGISEVEAGGGRSAIHRSHLAITRWNPFESEADRSDGRHAAALSHARVVTRPNDLTDLVVRFTEAFNRDDLNEVLEGISVPEF